MGIIEWLKRLGRRPVIVKRNGVEYIADYLDVLDGAGRHLGHERIQDGQWVRCSCGTVAMGRMENGK